MTPQTIVSALALIAALSTPAAGWYAKDYVASNDDLMVVASKMDYVIDKQMELIVSQISRLEVKPTLTPSEASHLNYLRDELRRLREIRRGQ